MPKVLATSSGYAIYRAVPAGEVGQCEVRVDPRGSTAQSWNGIDVQRGDRQRNRSSGIQCGGKLQVRVNVRIAVNVALPVVTNAPLGVNFVGRAPHPTVHEEVVAADDSGVGHFVDRDGAGLERPYGDLDVPLG